LNLFKKKDPAKVGKVPENVCVHTIFLAHMDRLTTLHEFYDQDPTDPFNAYALALEYRKNNASRALGYFEVLLRDFPAYLPTYYHAAQLYADLGEDEAARRTYQTGIERAQQAGQAHALRELRAAYQQWSDEHDE
jgi:tetratricopeptide (TPR) repeat protein